MASALIRAVRRVRPVRAASPSRSTGPSPSASNRPSSLAANRCLLAMKPCAISKIRRASRRLGLPQRGLRGWSSCPQPERRLPAAAIPRFWGCHLAPRTAVPSKSDRSVGAADPRRHRATRRARTHLGGLQRRRRGRAGDRHPLRRLLLPHRRPGNHSVHRERQPERRLLRVLAGPPRVRHRGRQQVVLPRPQRPDRGGDQHRHPRRPVPVDPAPVPRGLRLRRRAARVVRRRRHLLGSGGLPAQRRRALVHRGRGAHAGRAGSRDRGRPATLHAGAARFAVRRRSRSTTARASSSSMRTASRSRSRVPRSAGSASWSRTLPRAHPSESKLVQAVAARARSIAPGTDPLELAARARVRTRSGTWLLLYGTRLSGDQDGRTAVIIHPATPQDVAPVIALSYGLTERECQVAMQCVQGRVTKEIARALSLSRVHRAGPPQVDLRQDRRAQPRRAGRADLPRPLRDPLGGSGNRDTWPAGARHLSRPTLTGAA